MDCSDSAFTARRVGTSGHEIMSPQGEVIAWTVDAAWAAVIAGLLNRVDVRDPSLSAARNGDAGNPSTPD